MIGVGAVDVKVEAFGRPQREVGLDAADADLAGIGEVAAQHADLVVGDRRLIVADLGPEARQVERRAAIQELGLEPDLVMIDLLGLHRRGAQDRVVLRVQR